MAARALSSLDAAGSPEQFDEASERILDATHQALIEHGLRRTSLDDVARQAGISRATLFRRFSSRGELLGAFTLREAQRVISHIDSQITSLASPEAQMTSGFVAFIRFARDHPLLTRLLETDPEQMLPLITTAADPILALGRGYAETMFRRAQADGAQLTAEPEHLAEIIVRLAHSLVLTPRSTLPLDDTQLAAFARATLVPMSLRASPDR